MKVSIFKNFNQVVENIDLSAILEHILSGKYSAIVLRLRELVSLDKYTEYNEKKKSLPAFTPSGLFDGGRKLEFLKEYSGCLVLDIDKLSHAHLDEARAKIIEIPYTYSCFLSPSGQGLKILVKVISRPVFHKQIFEQVKDYYEHQLGLTIDPSGKDVTRLCFVSWDEELYLNHTSAVFKTQERGPGVRCLISLGRGVKCLPRYTSPVTIIRRYSTPRPEWGGAGGGAVITMSGVGVITLCTWHLALGQKWGCDSVTLLLCYFVTLILSPPC
jgi:hypothetical protein